MVFPGQKQRVALISVHGDPAIEIGREEAGGQNVYVRQIGEALSRQGWLVDMFTRRSHPQQPGLVQHNESCRTIRLSVGPQEFIPRDQLFSYLPDFVEAMQRFQRESGFHYMLVHTNYWLSSWVGMALKRQQPLKQVHTYHSLGSVKYQATAAVSKVASTRLATEKRCLETAERIVATSPQEEAHMQSLISSEGKIEVIPCGADVQKFGSLDRATARSRLGLDPTAKVVFYIGRFDRRKGIATLVQAVYQSRLRNQIQLLIGGGSRPGHSDGLERARIETLVAKLNLQPNTTFLGRLTMESLQLHYAAADVCVVPSHYEPFGLVAIEAMASGTPVIASAVGGLQFTVIPEVTGLLAPPKSTAEFAVAIDRILADPAWRDELGQAGRQRVEMMFSWDGVATQLSKLYKRVLKEPAKVPPVPIGV